MRASDLLLSLRHARRVPVKRLALRLQHQVRRRRLRTQPATTWRLAGPRPSPPRPASPLPSLIEAWRRGLFQAPADAANPDLIWLRGQPFAAAELERVDWAALGRHGEGRLNQDFELSYLGFLLPAAPQAIGAVLPGILHRIEQAGLNWSDALAWKPISVANRLINLIALCAKLEPGQEDALAAALDHGDLCCGFLERFREDYLGYNHLVFNIVAILAWRDYLGWPIDPRLAGDLIATLNEQVLADGGHAERSPTYHVHVLSLCILAAAARALGDDDRAVLLAIAERMRAALGVMTHPDGDIALFNDAARMDAPPASLFLRDAPTAARAHDVLPVTGYAKLARGEDCIILDCGPMGPPDNPCHAHADYLSCEISLGGVRFLVDPGVASYASGPLRNNSRASSSHNGPCVAGRDLAEFGGAFRVGRASQAFLEPDANDGRVTAVCRPYFAPDAELRRSVALDQDGISIIDRWVGIDGPALTLLVGPDWRLERAAGDQIRFVEIRSGQRAEVRVLEGRLEAPTTSQFHPFGPGAPQAVTRIEITPLSLGASNHRQSLVIAAMPAGSRIESDRS